MGSRIMRQRIGRDLLVGLIVLPLWIIAFPDMPWWGWVVIGAIISTSSRLTLEGRS